MDKTICPSCGKSKKPWFALCWECTEKENQKPKCDVCNIEVPEGHHLCKTHWKEKQEDTQKLKSIDFVKAKKETEFREKFPGKYSFGAYKVKSKSELLICYFLTSNGIHYQYEPVMHFDKEIRPDFVIDDYSGHTIIIEHFGMNDAKYNANREIKERDYNKLCKENKNFHFVSTDEEDMFNLKESRKKMK
ncbi:MAG: hypothetical protein WDM90_21125 [Ferruginibacter sp.]